ncbi:MAG TPA: hypothetical protein P5272_04585 [Caldisericia bacterium]|nr:hypothetical protein [Caldisericia bacterium]MBP8991727.1 hypothetical protein [Spirochaetota bacterium]HRU74236.1 hypothetical protein [Caldisericia bacterium]
MIFSEKVLWYKQNGRDKYGAIKYDDPIEKKCKIEEVTRRVVDREGDFYISQFRIFFEDIFDINIGDKIEINSEDYIVNEIHIEKDYYNKAILKWIVVKEI